MRHASRVNGTVSVATDCVGVEETIQMGFGLLSTAGTYVSVGLVGSRINIPLFPLLVGSSRITVPLGGITLFHGFGARFHERTRSSL